RTGRAARAHLVGWRWLALIDETLSQTTSELLCGVFLIIAVITCGFAGEQHMQDIVAIVVPLRIEIPTVARLAHIAACGAATAVAQMSRAVVFIFQNQVHEASRFDCFADARRHFIKPARIRYLMDGIEAQAVESIFEQPIQRVLQKKIPYLRPREIDSCSPRRMFAGVEKGRGIAIEEIAVGADVVVRAVGVDADTARGRAVAELRGLVGWAVAGVRCEWQPTVVSPIALARKIGGRHQLGGGDAQLGKFRQLAPDAGEAATTAD